MFHSSRKFFVLALIALSLFALTMASTGAELLAKSAQQPSVNDGADRIPVRFHLGVRDKDKRFVPDLRKEDIRVLENDLPQTIVAFEQSAESPTSIVLLIQASESEQRLLPRIKLAAREFIGSDFHPATDRAAVVSFTGRAVLQQGLTNELTKLDQAIERVNYAAAPADVAAAILLGKVSKEAGERLTNGAAIWDAVWAACDDVLQSVPGNNRRVIILLTDGEDTASRLQMNESIQRAIRADVAIYAVGLGDDEFNNVNKKVLRKLTEETGGREFFPGKVKNLKTAFAEIGKDLRSEYLISYSATKASDYDEYRKLRIEILNPQMRKRGVQVFHRQGYYARFTRI